MQQKLEKNISNGEFSRNDNFFLNNDFLQKAFANLSKNTNTVKKTDLIDETKRLIKEYIMQQIRENQINSKKFRLKKNKR